MTSFLSKIRYWIPALVWMGIIFFLSSRPSVQAAAFDPLDFLIKKTAHLIEYFILFQLIHYGVGKTLNLNSFHRILFSLFLTVCYAVTDELHQTFIPGREGTPRDVIIDLLGAVISARLYTGHFKQYRI